MILQRQIHQELLISSKVKLTTGVFYLYQDQSRTLVGLRRNIRECGSRLTALNTSPSPPPLPFILKRWGYDFDGAAAKLLQFSMKVDDHEQSLLPVGSKLLCVFLVPK
jgi:hypothetical protein